MYHANHTDVCEIPKAFAAKKFELVILGGGSAAFAAALKATELGAEVAICEDHVKAGHASTEGAYHPRAC